MLQFNVVWCIRSCREIMLTIQSDNGKQGYKVGGKKYRRPKVVLPRGPCERYSSDWIRRRDQSWARSVVMSMLSVTGLLLKGLDSLAGKLIGCWCRLQEVLELSSPIHLPWVWVADVPHQDVQCPNAGRGTQWHHVEACCSPPVAGWLWSVLSTAAVLTNSFSALVDRRLYRPHT